MCFPQRNYELAVKDCEEALVLCEENRRALYRKAVCLKELGKYREAYECTTRFLLISRVVSSAGNLGPHSSKMFYKSFAWGDL